MLPADGDGVVEGEVRPLPALPDVPGRFGAREEEALATHLAVGADARAAIRVLEPIWRAEDARCVSQKPNLR